MEYSLLQWTGYIHYGEVRRGCGRYKVLSRAAKYDKDNFYSSYCNFYMELLYSVPSISH